ncbi:MAG: alkaline phosphatase D family protein, partial [Bacteroidota bacterium]
YAVWDDHDFGPNDSHGGFQFKNESQKVFRTMWPNQGYANFNGMNFGKIELNDIEIYFLDNRFNRTSPKLGKSAQMLGADQLEWLFNNLVTSKASFKLIVVGSQILNSEAVFETFANYSEERMYVINKLQELNIKNVIFLSGDRHFSECSEINSNSSNRLVDITSSPLTSKPYTNVSEKNLNRVEGSLIQEQNFATFQFSGEDKKRKVLVSFKNSTGTTLWSKSYSMN